MAETVEEDQPLTPAGRLFLQPLMNQVINCVLGSDYPIDLGCVKTQIQNSIMLKHPRFCSLMVRDSSGREHWRKTQVDVDRHLIIRHHFLTDDLSVSDEDAINDYMADLSFSSPLPTDKPLWEIHVLAAHKAVVFRVHHALGDGISLMSMLLSSCRNVDDPAQLPTIGGVGAASLVPRRWSVWTLMKVVWFTLVSILEFVLKLLWLRDKTTVLSGGSGVELWPRQLVTARFRLDDMKTVKRALADSTINDVLLGVISTGFSRYLDVRSSTALQDGDQITGLAMVNLRPQSGLQDLSKLMDSDSGTPWGNKFGIILLPVCYHRASSDPLQFVRRAKAMIDRKKLSLEAPFSHTLLDWITSLFGAKLTSILNYRIVCNTTFTISNLVGPREQITLAGHPVKFIRVTSSSLPHAITMHMLSYAGLADMQILVAKEVIPDPKVLAKCFEDALLEMKQAAEAAIKSQGSCQ
ncbi:O-acyltransferase WSD1 [Sesamum angolense]|uniref:O-acyltransferase WSD1 n=1 Tax=Sesamum angolense TaxID=2727404 RepID=A0AAE1WY34_9LAMI|nr:O-acyltransferase WSD1 [Sesamum angolense]